MPEINITGFKRRITAEFPDLSTGQVKAAAKRIAWRAAHMNEVFDFYAELRILGIIPDPTALEAVENVEAAA